MTIKEVSEKYKISRDTLRYYERAGMIPAVTRTAGGIRDYSIEDIRWVELAICMRDAGMPVEIMAQYVKLYQKGDCTFPERLHLLREQKKALLVKKKQIETMLTRLDEKIARYQKAADTKRPE